MAKTKIGRRLFLNIGAASVASAATSAQAKTKKSAGWDGEADVVCVGSGAAALAAAVTAVSNGDKTIVLEKLPAPGGTTLKSGGAAWLPNNSVMSAAGVVDAEEACLRYMARYAYPERYAADAADFGIGKDAHALLHAFYTNARPMEEKLRSLGALNLVAFRIPGSDIISPDYAASLAQDEAKRGRTLWPQPSPEAFGGSAMIGGMVEWLEKKSAPVLLEHRVKGLIWEDKRVVGVEAEADGKLLRFRARKGVIFASGGFAHNFDLVQTHQPTGLHGSCATPGATGDFMPIAEAAGAKMANLSTAWRMQIVLEEALKNRHLTQGIFIPPGDSMILVNKFGKRVVNEKRNYNDRTNIHFVYDPTSVDYPNQILMMVFDQRGIDVFGGAYPIPESASNAPYLISGANWSELSLNISARLTKVQNHTGAVALAPDFAVNLADTVKRFNGYAKTGKDEDFHRGRDSHEAEWRTFFSPIRKGAEAKANKGPSAVLAPFTSKGPYYAILVSAGALDTSGGPMIDAEARVLGADGQPISGLFGAGNCIGSPTRGAYFGGGGTLGPALTFGYIAANSAHRG